MSAEVELIVETPQGVEVHVKAPRGKAYRRATLTYTTLPSREALMKDIAEWLATVEHDEGERVKNALKETRVEMSGVERGGG